VGNGFLVVNEKAWEDTPPESRDKLIFLTLQAIDQRLCKLEKAGFYHKACATGGGIFGGIIAALGIKWLGN